MAKENKILAIDVGNDSLKMAEFVFPDGAGILMSNFLFRKVERLENESESSCFERNYLEMLEEGGFTATDVRLMLSSSNSFQRLSKLPPILGSTSAVSRLIEFEASQAVPYSMDEVEWGYQLLHHSWTDTRMEEMEDGSTEPVEQFHEEYEALFVAMKEEDVVCFTDVIEGSGKKLLSVELAPLALFNAAIVSRIRPEESTLLLDIGARSSCLMIADNRRIFMRNIPIGGDTVTAQISKEFGFSTAEAEDYKRRHGFVALGGAYDDPDSELVATISKIARNVMTRLHGEISRSISVWRAQHGGSAPVRMLLAGGGSTMQYTTDFFQEKLRMPVEYLNTFGLISISENVNKNQLQNVASMSQSLIGAALHNVGTCPVDISLLPKLIRKQYELNARKPYFYASAVALVSCMLISVIGVSRVLSFEKKRVGEVEYKVSQAEKAVRKIRAVKGELDSWQGKYEESVQFLRDRDRYAKVMNELQNMIPDRMWLVVMEPARDNEESSYTEDESGSSQKVKVDPNLPTAPEKINAMRELKKIRLVGYALKLDNRDLFQEFRSKIEKSVHFEPQIRTRQLINATNNNLTYFEIIITLKEALKK